MDASLLSTLLIVSTSLVTTLSLKATASNRSQNVELRGRRKREQLKDRYIARFEHDYDIQDKPYPEKPEGLVEAEKEEW